MISRWPFAAVAITTLFVHEGSCFSQVPQRTIMYDPAVPIASRLLPGDGVVEVAMMKGPPPLTIDLPKSESFDQQVRRLSKYETIAVVRVSAVGGELTDDGAWTQTRVRAEVSQASGAGAAQAPGSTVEFTFRGGTTRIGTVTVTAGAFPIFVQNDRYLVFLYSDYTPRRTFYGMAYHIDARGILEPLKTNVGTVANYESGLPGRNASEVMRAFRRVKS